MSINSVTETMCVPNRQIYNSVVFDMINFGFLYVTPLLVMTVSTSNDYVLVCNYWSEILLVDPPIYPLSVRLLACSCSTAE